MTDQEIIVPSCRLRIACISNNGTSFRCGREKSVQALEKQW